MYQSLFETDLGECLKETSAELEEVKNRKEQQTEECEYLVLENEALKSYINNYQKMIKQK